MLKRNESNHVNWIAICNVPCPAADYVRPVAAHACWARSEARVTTLSTRKESVGKVVSKRNAGAKALLRRLRKSRLRGCGNPAACCFDRPPDRPRAGRWSGAERGALPKQHAHRSGDFAKIPCIAKSGVESTQVQKVLRKRTDVARISGKPFLQYPWGAKAGGNQEAQKRPRLLASTGPGEPDPWEPAEPLPSAKSDFAH